MGKNLVQGVPFAVGPFPTPPPPNPEISLSYKYLQSLSIHVVNS